MRLSARADYALRAAIELAAAEGDRVTAEQLSQAQGIPGQFLATILTHLQRVWNSLRAHEQAVLEAVTLADIISGNLP